MRNDMIKLETSDLITLDTIVSMGTSVGRKICKDCNDNSSCGEDHVLGRQSGKSEAVSKVDEYLKHHKAGTKMQNVVDKYRDNLDIIEAKDKIRQDMHRRGNVDIKVNQIWSLNNVGKFKEHKIIIEELYMNGKELWAHTVHYGGNLDGVREPRPVELLYLEWNCVGIYSPMTIMNVNDPNQTITEIPYEAWNPASLLSKKIDILVSGKKIGEIENLTYKAISGFTELINSKDYKSFADIKDEAKSSPKCNCLKNTTIDIDKNRHLCGAYVEPEVLGAFLESEEYKKVTKIQLNNSEIEWSGKLGLWDLINEKMVDSSICNNIFSEKNHLAKPFGDAFVQKVEVPLLDIGDNPRIMPMKKIDFSKLESRNNEPECFCCDRGVVDNVGPCNCKEGRELLIRAGSVATITSSVGGELKLRPGVGAESSNGFMPNSELNKVMGIDWAVGAKTNVCESCKETYEYAEPIVGFRCWECKNGF